MANEYIDRGLEISDIATILHVPRCGFYRNGWSGEEPLLRKRRHNLSFSLRKDGDEATTVDSGIVVNEMEKLLSREFVCYGYKKTAENLNKLGYEINRKNVRRLMTGNNLLNHSYNKKNL